MDVMSSPLEFIREINAMFTFAMFKNAMFTFATILRGQNFRIYFFSPILYLLVYQ